VWPIGLHVGRPHNKPILRRDRILGLFYLLDCQYDAVCFMSSADRGVVYKVAAWRSGSGRIHFVTVAVLRPFRHIVRPIWQMILHTIPNEVRGRQGTSCQFVVNL